MISAALRARLFLGSTIGTLTPFASRRRETALEWLNDGNRSQAELRELLQLFRGEANRSEIAASWLEKEGRVREDLVEFLPFVITEYSKATIAASWLEKEGRVKEDLVAILPLVTNEYSKATIAIPWSVKEGRVKEDLVAILPLVTDEYVKSTIAESLLRKEGRVKEDLVEFLPLVIDVHSKSAIAESWFREKGRAREDLAEFLPLVIDANSKSTILKSWLMERGRAREDLVEFLPLVTDPYSKSKIAKSWLKEEGRTKENLVEFLPFVRKKKIKKTRFSEFDKEGKNESKAEVVISWLDKEGRAREDLVEFLPLVIDKNSKFKIATSWLWEKRRSGEDIMAVIELFADDYSRSGIAQSWFREAGGGKEDLEAFLPLVSSEHCKSNIAESWISREGRTVKDLAEVLELFAGHHFKYQVATSWIKKEGRTKEDLAAALPFIDKYSKSGIAASWIEKEGRSKEDLLGVLELFSDEDSKSEIAASWLEKEGRIREDLVEFLPLVIDKNSKLKIAESWTWKEGRSKEDLAVVLELFADEKSKSKVAESWIIKKGRAKEDLVVVLPFIDKDSRASIAELWLKEDGKDGEDMAAVLELFADEEFKSRVAKSWLKEEVRAKEDLLLALPCIIDEFDKSSIVETWFLKEERAKEDLLELLPLIYNEHKLSILQIFLATNDNEESRYNNLLHFAKAGLVGGMYDLQNIAATYQEVEAPVARFPEFCKTLYPTNENFQTELFCEGIRIFEAEPLSQNKVQFLNFATSLEGDQHAIESLADLKTKVALTPLEILQASVNRLNKNYESLSELLRDKLVVESLTPDGLVTIQNYFPPQEEGALPQDANLANLFSFYQIQEPPEVAITIFKSILKPEILQEMRDKFIPSNRNVLVLDRDFEVINSLLNEGGSADLGFLPVSLLSNHLAGSANFSNLAAAEIEPYQIGRSLILSEENLSQEERAELEKQRIEFNENFKGLLRNNNVSLDQIGEFFEKILSLETPINDRERGNLKDFFDRDKFLLARLLQQDGGLDKFAGAITTLADGCFANIGAQARIVLTQSLIKDPCDQILFRVFGEKVNGPMLANFDVNHLGEGVDAAAIFQDPRFAQHRLSPTGLVRAIREEFFKGDKKVEDSQEFLTKVKGEEFYQERCGAVEELFYEAGQAVRIAGLPPINLTPEILETHFANLAALAIVERKIPQLLENRHLRDFAPKVADLNLLLPPRPLPLPSIQVSSSSNVALQQNQESQSI